MKHATRIAALTLTVAVIVLVVGVMIISRPHPKPSIFDQCKTQVIEQIQESQKHPGVTYQDADACISLSPSQRNEAVREAAAAA